MATSLLVKPSITINPSRNHAKSIVQISVIKPFIKSPNFPRLVTNPRLIVKAASRGYLEGEQVNDMIILMLTEGKPCKEVSILQLQVGLPRSAMSLKKDLDQLSYTATSDVAEILTETTLAILRHSDRCISGHSTVSVVSHKNGVDSGFKYLSDEERGKSDKEILVNLNNIEKQCRSSKKSSESEEYKVVQISVGVVGIFDLPTIISSENVKEALKFLSSICKSKTWFVEVHWTTEDKLTQDELPLYYPNLHRFK